MKARSPRTSAIALYCLALAGWAAPPARGQTVVTEEVREFDILVKDKHAGKNTIRISDLDDGTTRVATEVVVKLNYLVFVYRYEFRGQETWRGDRLLWTENHATDDGKTFEVRAQNDAGGFRVQANGRSRAEPIIDMTTNYWRAPELKQDRTAAFLNADRGTIHRAKLERLAPESLPLGSRSVACSHYRFSGEVQAELWFDGRNRIVRQKSIEDGYPTELRLTRVTRQTPTTAQRAPPRSSLR